MLSNIHEYNAERRRYRRAAKARSVDLDFLWDVKVIRGLTPGYLDSDGLPSNDKEFKTMCQGAAT